MSYHAAMDITKLSSKGQIVLPKAVRETHGWVPGTEFTVELTPDGVRLRPRAPFTRTGLDDVAGSVPYSGPVVTLDEMDEAVRAVVAKRHRRSRKR